MIAKSEIAALKKRAVGFAAINLIFGVGGMLFSLGEESVGWTFFVWLAGIEGISIGLLAGAGFAQLKLDVIPQDWKMTRIGGFFWVILTYWAPIVVTFLFGTMLYTTLPDAALPRSKLEGSTNAAGLMQSLVTFFNANGCVWLMVFLVANHVENSMDATATDATATDAAVDVGK